MTSETDNIRIGIPSKGRLADQATELLTSAGLSFRRQDRYLFARVSEMPVEIAFLRTGDIPLLCAEGAVDMGITGGDLVAESGVDLVSRLALGFGRCRLSVCVPDDSTLQTPAELDRRRVATSFPNLADAFFRSQGAEVHLVPLSGSVEIMVSLGVADAIVDIVQTGSTLAANRLRVLARIGNYETILVQNAELQQTDIADLVVRRLEGVVIARAWSLLEYNILREKLPEAERIAPGFNSPTVNSLEDSTWCAVEVMVRRDDVIGVMDRLESIGATAILETRIENCRL